MLCEGDELQWQVLQHHPALQTLHVSLCLKQPLQKELLDLPQLHVLILRCSSYHLQKVTQPKNAYRMPCVMLETVGRQSREACLPICQGVNDGPGGILRLFHCN